MKINIKKIFPWALLLIVLTVAAVKETSVVGPAGSTTPNAVVRWRDSSGWKSTNSVVTVADNGDVAGINNMSINQGNFSVIYVTNGFSYLQKSSAPTVSDIGGTVGSVTNHLIINVNGVLYDYWSDGVTLYGPKQLSP